MIAIAITFIHLSNRTTSRHGQSLFTGMQAEGLPSVTGSLSSQSNYIPNAGLPFGAKVACADAEHNNPYMHVMLSILESQTGRVPFSAFN